MIPATLVANGVASVVANYLKEGRSSETRETVELPETVLSALATDVERLQAEDSPGLVKLSREALKPPAQQAEGPAVPGELGAAALAISPANVFKKAKRQNKYVFLVGFVLAVTLAIIFIAGIVGIVVSAVFLKEAAPAGGFVGVSIIDAAGFAITKPFGIISGANVSNQCLDVVYVRLEHELTECAGHRDRKKRFECNTQVWDRAQAGLRELSAK